jgi:Ni/Fe-hydrogenase subunit HybB-like protein
MSAVVQTAATPAYRWITAQKLTDSMVTEAVADPVLAAAGLRWWIALGLTVPFVIWTVIALVWLLTRGIGAWGVNTTVVWGFAIANYVWWIAIGSGGTLISSILVLTGQSWRSSVNRFAESMTLFAVAISGIFPIIHLGRPTYFYWLAPYPNTMSIWPQWRSALVWDFWAILSYLLFSLLFFYVGLLPDLGTMRDRSKTRSGQFLYGLFALGWRGSARHWRLHSTLHHTLAALAVPLVTSVHSIVGLDFAASLMPGWQESIFPPYFVVGALFSGFAMVLLVAAAVRWGLRLESIVTINHFDAMAKIILTGSILMTYSYATEWFIAWYSGDHAERSLVAFLFIGHYAPLYWTLILLNCVQPHVLWFRRVRRSVPALVVISVLILIGMWIERILIIWNTLSHDYTPSLWRAFRPTFWDFSFLFGPLGLFVFLFLIFIRLVPAVSMHETRRLAHKEGVA